MTSKRQRCAAIVLQCQGDPVQHEQTIALPYDTQDQAREWAALLNGTSPRMIGAQDASGQSMLGHCGICGAVMTAEAGEIEIEVSDD